MENSLFKNMCGHLNYDTYESLTKGIFLSDLGLSICNLTLFRSNLGIRGPINLYVDISLIIGYLLVCANGKVHTKDYKELKELYTTFIKNYNELNKTFKLKNPVEIYAMYNYLLYEGYLSCDKSFEFSSKNARDIEGLHGSNIMTGSGVCRHISALLCDILKDYGIVSSVLTVLSDSYVVTIKELEEPKYTKEELIKWTKAHFVDEHSRNLIITAINELVDEHNIELSYRTKEIKNPIEKSVGNHAISFAYDDGYVYYLDATQSSIYRVNQNNKDELNDSNYADRRLIMKYNSLTALNNKKESKILKEMVNMNLPSIPIFIEKRMIDTTLTNCKANMNLVEDFYNDNKELYDEISQRVLKFKK